MNIEEYGKRKRDNQRQELLAIAYGNAPDHARAEALRTLNELDKIDEREAVLDTIREELEKAMQEDCSATADEKRAGLHEMDQSARDYLSKWCKNAAVEFYQEESRIYNSLLAGENDKAVERRIYNLYKNMRKFAYNDRGKRIPLPNWKEYLQEFAQAYGVQLYPYKPNPLK